MFSKRRLKEWVRVVQLGKPGPLHWVKMFWGVLTIALKGIDRRTWKKRMRACYECPIYNPMFKRCGPFAGSTLGCGCYTPYSNMQGKECWGRRTQEGNFGWGED